MLGKLDKLEKIDFGIIMDGLIAQFREHKLRPFLTWIEQADTLLDIYKLKIISEFQLNKRLDEISDKNAPSIFVTCLTDADIAFMISNFQEDLINTVNPSDLKLMPTALNAIKDGMNEFNYSQSKITYYFLSYYSSIHQFILNKFKELYPTLDTDNLLEKINNVAKAPNPRYMFNPKLFHNKDDQKPTLNKMAKIYLALDKHINQIELLKEPIHTRFVALRTQVVFSEEHDRSCSFCSVK